MDGGEAAAPLSRREMREAERRRREELEDEKANLEEVIEQVAKKSLRVLRRAAAVDTDAFVNGVPAISMIGDSDTSLQLTFEKLRKLKGHDGKVYDFHWSDDGVHLLTAAQDGHLIVWNCALGTKSVLVELDTPWVMACAFGPQNMGRRLVASGGLDNDCTIHDVTAAMDSDSIDTRVEKVTVLEGHKGNLSHCRFVGSHGGLFTASGDGEIWQWDINRPGEPVAKFTGHGGDVTSFDFFPGSESEFVSSSIDGMVKLWDARSPRPCVSTFKGHGLNDPAFQHSAELDVNKVVVHPGGDGFASCGADGTARMWSRCADQQIDQFWRTEGPDDPRSASYDDDCQTLAFSQSGRLLFVSSTRRVPEGQPEDLANVPAADADVNTVAIYDILTADRTTDFNIQKKTSRARITSLGVSPGGECLTTAGFDGIVRLWGVNHKRSGPWRD